MYYMWQNIFQMNSFLQINFLKKYINLQIHLFHNAWICPVEGWRYLVGRNRAFLTVDVHTF